MLTCALCWGLSNAAWAGPADGVILFREGHGLHTEAEERTRDELRMMNIRVDEFPVPDDDARVGLLMAEHGARAAVRLECHEDTFVVVAWFSGGSQRNDLFRQEFMGVHERLVALKTAELIHHHLVAGERSVAPSTSTSTEPPVPEAPVALSASGPTDSLELSAVAPEAWSSVVDLVPNSAPGDLEPEEQMEPVPSWLPVLPRISRERWIGVSPSVGGGPGGAGALLGGSLAFGWRALEAMSLRTEVFAVASPVPVQIESGAVRVGQVATQLLVALEGHSKSRVSPRLQVGGGPGLVWASGIASPPLRGRTEFAIVGVITAGVGLGIRLAPRLRIVVECVAHVLAPPVRLRVDGGEVARIGLPIVRGLLGVEWRLDGRGLSAEKK